MSGLVPIDKRTERKRPTSEAERTRLRQQREKAEYHRRNPDSRWK